MASWPQSKEASPSLASCSMWASSNTIECLLILWSRWKLDSGGMQSISAGLFVVVQSVVQAMLLTSESVMCMGWNLPMTVWLGICTMLGSMLSRGMCSNFAYLWSILWSTASGIIHGGKLSAASSWYRYFVFHSVDAFMDMTNTLLCGNMFDPELQTIGFVWEEWILVQNSLLLCVIYCWPFMF